MRALNIFACGWRGKKSRYHIHGNASTESDAAVPTPLFRNSEEQCVLVEGGGGLVVDQAGEAGRKIQPVSSRSYIFGGKIEIFLAPRLDIKQNMAKIYGLNNGTIMFSSTRRRPPRLLLARHCELSGAWALTICTCG